MKTGEPCSFYHEGGHGERYWSNGWRYGIIREMPIKGQHKNHYRLEIPVPLFGWDQAKYRWYRRLPLMVWVHVTKVNTLGDFAYHGQALREIVAERREQKAADVKKARRRAKA